MRASEQASRWCRAGAGSAGVRRACGPTLRREKQDEVRLAPKSAMCMCSTREPPCLVDVPESKTPWVLSVGKWACARRPRRSILAAESRGCLSRRFLLGVESSLEAEETPRRR